MSATLASLRIRNLALVEDLTWEPPGGFVAVTGETGAGKSIIVGGLKLLIGERGDKGAVRTGADACVVEGCFDVSPDSFVHAILEDAAVEPCENGQMILKRILPVSGSGRQYVNGSPCSLTVLKKLGDRLVDLHGPHDHQSLFSCEEQLRLVDSHAGAGGLFLEYCAIRKEWMRRVSEKKAFSENAEAMAREIDLLIHQTTEIDEANLRAGEEEELVSRQRTGANAQRLMTICTALESVLSDSDDSLTARWGEVSRLVRELHRLAPEAASIHQATEHIFESLQEMAQLLQRYSGGIDSDPRCLEVIETRLDLIQSLKRKYGSTIDEVLRFGADAAKRLELLQTKELRREGLYQEIADAAKSLALAGEKL